MAFDPKTVMTIVYNRLVAGRNIYTRHAHARVLCEPRLPKFMNSCSADSTNNIHALCADSTNNIYSCTRRRLHPFLYSAPTPPIIHALNVDSTNNSCTQRRLNHFIYSAQTPYTNSCTHSAPNPPIHILSADFTNSIMPNNLRRNIPA